jgi:hypothetical protein
MFQLEFRPYLRLSSSLLRALYAQSNFYADSHETYRDEKLTSFATEENVSLSAVQGASKKQRESELKAEEKLC